MVALSPAGKHGGTGGQIEGYELLTELFAGRLGAMWTARPTGGDESTVVEIRRVRTRPPVTRKAAGDLEAAAAWALSLEHPSLVEILGSAAGKGEFGIVQARHPGETLAGLLDIVGSGAATLDTAVVLSISLGVLDALQYLHAQSDERGLRVGNVCAEGILVGTDGKTQLREAGVASVAARTVPWANDPRRVAYRAPESLKLAAKLDGRSDVFSVGVLIWEMLAGTRLFDGKTRMAVQQAVRRAPIINLEAKTDGGVGSAMAEVVARALAREPDERYATIEALAEALRALPVEPAATSSVGALVDRLAGDRLRVCQEAIEQALAQPPSGESAVAATPAGHGAPPPPAVSPPPPCTSTPKDRPSSEVAKGSPPPPVRKGPSARRPPPTRKGPPLRIKPRVKPRWPPTSENEALATGEFELLSTDGEPDAATATSDEGIDVSFSEPPDAPPEQDSAEHDAGAPDAEEPAAAQAAERTPERGGAEGSPPPASLAEQDAASASDPPGAPALSDPEGEEVIDDSAAEEHAPPSAGPDDEAPAADRPSHGEASSAGKDSAGPNERTPDDAPPESEGTASIPADAIGEPEAPDSGRVGPATAAEADSEAGPGSSPNQQRLAAGDETGDEAGDETGDADAAAPTGETPPSPDEVDGETDKPVSAEDAPISFAPPPPSIEDLPVARQERSKLLLFAGVAVLLIAAIWALSSGSSDIPAAPSASPSETARTPATTAAPTTSTTSFAEATAPSASANAGSGGEAGAASAAPSAITSATATAPLPHRPRHPTHRPPRRHPPKRTFTPSDI